MTPARNSPGPFLQPTPTDNGPNPSQIRERALEGLFDLVLVTDPTGRCLQVQPERPPAGLFTAPATGHSLRTCMSAELADAFMTGLEQCLHTGRSGQFSRRLDKPDRTLQVRTSPSIVNGIVQGVTYFGTTEALQDPLRCSTTATADAPHPDSEAALASVIQRLDHGVLLQGPNAEILMSNQAALDMLGLSEAQLLGSTSFDPDWRVVREDDTDFPGTEHPVPTAIALKRPVRNVTMGVYRPRTKDRVWLQVSAVPEIDELGEVKHVVCSFIDITARRDALNELRREHDFTDQVMMTSVAGIAVLDNQDRIIFANPAAEQVLGLTPSNCGERAYKVPEWKATSLDGSPWPDEASPFFRVMATRAPVYNVRHAIEWPDGTRKSLSINGAPVFDDTGKIERLVFAIMEITEQLKAEGEQRRLDAHMEELARQESLAVLAGGVAHDYNNLLVGILTAAEIATEDLDPSHPASEQLRVVHTAADRAAALTQQLLAYSGRGQFVVRQLDLSGLAEQMKGIVGVLHRQVDLRINVDGGVPPIQADVNRVKQILLNLVLNAAEAMDGRPGHVTLRTGQADADADTFKRVNTAGQELKPGRFVYAEIEDRGVGMSPATRQRMFDPFFTTKDARQGLGLAAVQGVLRGHGGYVEVDSTLGEGTRIRVAFPAAVQLSLPIAPAPRSRGDWVPKGPVLIVDDEPMVLNMAKRILRRRGVEVLTARDGVEGMEVFLAQQDRIQAVLLDLTMPQLNGEEVLRQIRTLKPRMPVVLMSGFTEHQIAHPNAWTTFVAKPFSIEGLLAGLREVSESPALTAVSG